MSKKLSPQKNKIKSANASHPKETQWSYKRFDEINGLHPWQSEVPDGGNLYEVRKLSQGKVIYFNFELAREMGLISKTHPNTLTQALKHKIIDTFSIRIINEYDLEKNIKYPKSKIKENKFMATRYLQMQHKNKQGKTSGDGRSIWNGIIKNGNTLWDISSRGTGVTNLAPGAVEAGHPLQSGNTKFGYGCGLAEIDELLSTSILAEVFNCRNLRTERMLAVIDFGDGTGIGVRAGKNLIRPAHLFRYLKLGRREALQKAADYLIDRQTKNSEWQIKARDAQRFSSMLDHVCSDFAKFAAQLERNYIFSWLDWDGDNVLANAGIIDYGSVRLMGLRHDNYRFDDVERFSTNLNEQKHKAKLTVQVFAQAVDFIQSGRKKPLTHFKKHPAVQKFDKIFENTELELFLKQMGCSHRQIQYLIKNKKHLIKSFFKTFSKLEKVKTRRKMTKVTDGVNRPAILNMKQFLRHFPQLLLKSTKSFQQAQVSPESIFTLILSSYASRKDQTLTPYRKKQLELLQKQYKSVVRAISVHKNYEKTLQYLTQNSKIECPETPLTGNALLFIVNEILEARKKGLNDSHLQTIIEQLIQKYAPNHTHGASLTHPNTYRLWENMMDIIDGHKEDI